jgi:hypothetical protein
MARSHSREANNKKIQLRGYSQETIQTERLPLVGEVSANFCGVAWSAQQTPTAVNLEFLDPEPLLRKSRSAGISGSVARNSDHQTTEAVETSQQIQLLTFWALSSVLLFKMFWTTKLRLRLQVKNLLSQAQSTESSVRNAALN